MKNHGPLLVLMTALATPAAALSQAQNPILMLDAGGHTDSIPKVFFTPDGRGLISVSKDKTVRIWDLATGISVRTFRLPIGPGQLGAMYGGALSRDGRLLALGGIGPQIGECPVYLVTLSTGQIERVLKGHTHGVLDVAFTPDGKKLVSVGADNTGRIWNVATGTCEHILTGHRGWVEAVAVSPDNLRLVTASSDGTARIWSVGTGEAEVILKDAFNKVYYGNRTVAWASDGQTIAIGGIDRRVRLWNANGTLREVYGPVSDNVVHTVAFSPDGKELLVTRGRVGRTDCSLFNVATGKERLNFNEHKAFAWDGVFSPDGKLVATAGFLGEELLVWKASDGTIVHRLRGQSRTVWSAAWNADNSTIAWGNSGKRDPDNQFHPLERTFQTSELEWSGSPNKDFRQAREELGTLSLHRNKDGRKLSVKKAGEPICEVDIKGLVYCFSFVSDKHIAVGGQTTLSLFDALTGKELRRFEGHTGNPVAIAPSPNGRYLLSGSIDQTLRIWTLDHGEPLLSLFFAQNDWIAWTPQGYYAASPGGERLMGWHVNNGMDKMATFYPAAQFRNTLYRPDVIKLLLKTGSVAKALEMADKERGKQSSLLLQVTDVLPPLAVITTPDQPITVTEADFELRTLAKSTGKHPITAMRLFLDGRPYPGAEGLKIYSPPRLGQVRESWKIQVPHGKHQFAVQAESAVSKAMSEPVEIIYDSTRGLTRVEKEKKLAALERPSLYVLAIGVSAYPGDLKLNYAAKDAEVLAKTFAATSKDLYRKVEVKLLMDKEATRKNILQGLTWLRKQMTQRDVAIVTFAGHGDRDADGKFYLLPVDVDKDDLLSSAVSGEQMKSVLSALPGRVIVLLDACHSGAVDGDKKRSRGGLTDDLVRDLVTDDYGVIVMCSSMGREVSLESAAVEHGFFTLAVVEGLSGKADFNQDKVIHLNELDLYVTDRVKEISKGKQHPVTTKPASIRSFPLSRAGAASKSIRAVSPPAYLGAPVLNAE